MKRPGSHWAEANAALLAARGMEDLPAEEARALLALLHAGTLIELPDAAALRALDEQRLEWARQLGDPTLGPAEAERAALGLLALGHREAARALRAESPSPTLDAAWAAWVGEGTGSGGDEAALRLEGFRLTPAADRGELRITIADPVPSRLAVRRLRVGRSVLDVDLRRRPAGLVLRLARMHGDALMVTAALPPRFALATVDDVEDVAVPLHFEVRDRHEVVAYG
jgi:hypothetical protein